MLGTWEIELIRNIQRLANPILDWSMIILTHGLSPILTIGLMLIFYWIGHKRLSFKLVVITATSAVINQALKMLFAYPRPFKEGAISIGDPTSGYAFPSGHAQISATTATFLIVEYNNKNKYLKWFLIISVLIVAFSRMYLGQHYLSDVLVGIMLGVVIAFFVNRLIELLKEKEHYLGLLIACLTIAAVICILILDIKIEGLTTLISAAGLITGFLSGYFLDKTIIKPPKSPQKYKYLLRLVIGFLILGIIYFVGYFIPVNNLLFTYIHFIVLGFSTTFITTLIFKRLKI